MTVKNFDAMMNSKTIPFNRPALSGRELDYVRQSAVSGELAGDEAFSKQCHNFLQSTLGVRRALLTPSCTHALEMCALLLDIQPGDEVIVPSFTFVSTALAFHLRRAKLVFADVRPDTLNLDERRLAELITGKTRAIVVVHYAGVGCEMDEILRVAAERNIPVVEDNAHGLFGKYRGRWLGTMGDLGVQSFHATKNFTCGEGGALLINSVRHVERAEIIREKGTDRSRFFRGQVDKYSWVDTGSSYLLSDLQAAYLYAQLERWESIQMERQCLWERYAAELGGWAAAQGVQLPVVPAHCQQAYHMFYLLLPSLAARTALIEHLKAAGVQAVFHYLPLHLSKMGVQLGSRVGDCPVTEDVSDRLLRLPFFNSLKEPDQSRVIAAVISFNV